MCINEPNSIGECAFIDALKHARLKGRYDSDFGNNNKTWFVEPPNHIKILPLSMLHFSLWVMNDFYISFYHRYFVEPPSLILCVLRRKIPGTTVLPEPWTRPHELVSCMFLLGFLINFSIWKNLDFDSSSKKFNGKGWI